MISVGAREDQRGEAKESFIPAASVLTENGIAEEVWDRKTKPFYALRRFDQDEIDFVQRIESEEQDESGKPIVYVPADSAALRKKQVIVPRNPIEGTFEEAFKLGRELAHEIYDTSDHRKPEFDFLVAVSQASWFLDRFIPDPALDIAGMGHYAPIISLRGPSGHGKNRALSALRLNSYRPFYDQSTKRIPSLFRPLDLWRGSLCLDEADLGKSDEAADVVHYLNCRAYGTPISRQNPDSPIQSQAFHNFGLTIVTQRRAWVDDALENRTLPFNCERSQKNLATTELDDWLSEGLELQDRLLYLRLMYWDRVSIDKAARIPGLKDHRLTASVLPILALKGFAPDMVSDLHNVLQVLARRRQEVRAASSDGLVINHLWEKIDGGLVGTWNGRAYVGAEKVGDEKAGTAEMRPLQTSEMADALKWKSSDIRRIISSLQITPEDAPRHTVRIGRGTYRPIFINSPKLEVLLADFVVDYEAGTLERRLAEFAPGVTLVSDVSAPSTLSLPDGGNTPRGLGSVTTDTSDTKSAMDSTDTSDTKSTGRSNKL